MSNTRSMERRRQGAKAGAGRAKRADRPLGSPLRHLDIRAVSLAVRREVKHREHSLPTVSVFRWWARRTAAVSGAVLDAVARDLGENLRVVDPFAGGGTVAHEAIRRGHRVYAQDIDPWAAEGMSGSLSLVAPEAVEQAGRRLHAGVEELLQKAYGTRFEDGSAAHVAHTIRVAVADCPRCNNRTLLFPHATVSLFRRIDRDPAAKRAWIACSGGHLYQGHPSRGSTCPICREIVRPEAAYTQHRRGTCRICGNTSALSLWAKHGLDWQIVLVERTDGTRREIGRPRPDEVRRAETSWDPRMGLNRITKGHETRVLLRHGFRHWHDLYPARQRVVLEALLAAVPKAAERDPALERLLRILVTGAGEMAGHMSRWDPRYLKAYEAMAGHRYNFTTLAAEPNVWGVGRRGRGSVSLRIAAAVRAARWLALKAPSSMAGPIHRRARGEPFTVQATVACGSSEHIFLPDGSADVVWTDPPYHDDVRYHDLSAPFRAWLALGDVSDAASAVAQNSTDKRYARVIGRVFAECKRILAPHGRLLITFANREPGAWIALAEALRQAGFRARGYEIIRSDAETDVSKEKGRASTMDIVLDLVPAGSISTQGQYRPKRTLRSREWAFLSVVGEVLLAAIAANPPKDWKDRLKASRASAWLSGRGG